MGCISSIYAVKFVVRHILHHQCMTELKRISGKLPKCHIHRRDRASIVSDLCYSECSRASMYHGTFILPSVREIKERTIQTSQGTLNVLFETEQTLVAHYACNPNEFYIGIRGTRLNDTDDLIMDIHIMNGDLRNSKYFEHLVKTVELHMKDIMVRYGSKKNMKFILCGHSLGGTSAYLCADAINSALYSRLHSVHCFNPGISMDPIVLKSLRQRGSTRVYCPRFIHHIMGDLLSERFQAYPHVTMCRYRPVFTFPWDVRFFLWIYGNSRVFPFLKRNDRLASITLRDLVYTIQSHRISSFHLCQRKLPKSSESSETRKLNHLKTLSPTLSKQCHIPTFSIDGVL